MKQIGVNPRSGSCCFSHSLIFARLFVVHFLRQKHEMMIILHSELGSIQNRFPSSFECRLSRSENCLIFVYQQNGPSDFYSHRKCLVLGASIFLCILTDRKYLIASFIGKTHDVITAIILVASSPPPPMGFEPQRVRYSLCLWEWNPLFLKNGWTART